MSIISRKTIFGDARDALDLAWDLVFAGCPCKSVYPCHSAWRRRQKQSHCTTTFAQRSVRENEDCEDEFAVTNVYSG